MDDIKKVLWQWIDLYITELQDNMTFEIYKYQERDYSIKVDSRLCDRMFFILMDYLKYHDAIKFDIQKTGFKDEIRRVLVDNRIRNDIKIKGFITGREDNILKDKRLLVNMPAVAEYRVHEYFLITTDEDENYKIDFAGRVTASTEKREFKQPDNFAFQNPDTLTVRMADFADEIKERTEYRISKRFKPIAFLAFAILFLAHIFFLNDDLGEFMAVLGGGLFAWFFLDDKMLQSNRYYMYCFLITLVFVVCCIIEKQFFCSLLPLNFLVIQKPVRKLYKLLFKREPEISSPEKRFADFVYLMILVFGTVFSAVAIISVLK